MISVELIYDRNCPNVEKARGELLHALQESGLPSHWQEWDCHAPDSPVHVRNYGSPTILINGQDVAGASLSEGADSCRIYWDETGCPRGVPSSETILAGLIKAKQEDTAR